MGNIQVDIPPPALWQDFERLTLDMCREKWGDDYAERHGRQGQAQQGVDVHGINYSQSRERIGVQCKKRKRDHSSPDEPSNTLTAKEVDKAAEDAKDFKPPLNRLVVATTGPRDSKLQQHVREMSGYGFQTSIWFWDDYVSFLNGDHDMMYRYYENILKYRSQYDPTEHYFRMVSMAFDRPAIRTRISLENRATDFIDALGATQNALATGRLIDNEGNVIDEVRLPNNLPDQIGEIKKLLQEAREIATNALKQNIIVEHKTVIEVKNRDVQNKLNETRLQAVNLLNEVLEEKGFDEIPTPDY
jgi:hypothetical protein